MVVEQSSRVAIYARFSSDKQSDASIEDQVYRASAYIRAQGGNPDSATVFSDFAVSGASMERAGVQALMKAVASGAVDLVVAESLDRLSRSVSDLARFRETLAHHRVRLLCLDGTQLSATGKSDALLFGVRSLFAEQYLADLADKTLRGLEGRARAGKATGGAAYGYRNVRTVQGSTMEIDPDAARVVRRIFAEYAQGHSFARIAEGLNRDGIASPRAHSKRGGKGWMNTAIRAMLLNERYRGVVTFGAREWVKAPGTNARRPRARDGGPLSREERPELVIVDLATWNAVQARFDSRPSQPQKKARVYLLSGLARCAVCGGPFSCVGGSAGYRRFGCYASYKRGRSVCANRQTVKIAALEDAVLSTVLARLVSDMPEVLTIATEEIKAWALNRPNRRTDVSRELGEVERQLTNVVNLVIDTGSDALKARLRELEARKAALRAELATLDTDGTGMVLPTPREVGRRVASLENLTHADPDVARHMLRSLFADTRIDCAPQEDGSYVATWGLLPAALLGDGTTKAAGVAPGGHHRLLVTSFGCGGWI